MTITHIDIPETVKNLELIESWQYTCQCDAEVGAVPCQLCFIADTVHKAAAIIKAYTPSLKEY